MEINPSEVTKLLNGIKPTIADAIAKNISGNVMLKGAS